MRIGYRRCLLAFAVVMSFAVAIPAASAADPGPTTASASTAQSETTSEPDSDAPNAWDISTMVWQTLVGTGTTLAMGTGGLLLSLYALHGAESAESDMIAHASAAGAFGLIGGIPLVVPAVTNAVGSSRGYPSQRRGAFIGSLLGAGVFVGAGFVVEQQTSADGGGLIGMFPVGSVAGSVVGYHIQAQRRQSNQTRESGLRRGTPVVAPTVDADGDTSGLSLGWRANF